MPLLYGLKKQLCDLNKASNQITDKCHFQDTPHTYRVCGDSAVIGNIPTPVTFTTSDPVRLPLPNPRYLGVHAAYCKVARLSGAGEYSDKVFRDMEDTRVLSFEGSSAEMLSYALIRKLHVDPVL
jgi:hypothetical protein